MAPRQEPNYLMVTDLLHLTKGGKGFERARNEILLTEALMAKRTNIKSGSLVNKVRLKVILEACCLGRSYMDSVKQARLNWALP